VHQKPPPAKTADAVFSVLFFHVILHFIHAINWLIAE